MVIDTGPQSFASRGPLKNIICLNISRYLDNSQYINRNNVIFGNMPKWILLWFSEYHHIPIGFAYWDTDKAEDGRGKYDY